MDGAEARPVAICMDKGKKLQGICISQVLDFKKMFRRGKDLAGKKSGSELPHSKKSGTVRGVDADVLGGEVAGPVAGGGGARV